MKKKIILIVSLIVLAASSTQSISAETESTLRGDANADGVINILDVTAIQRYCAKYESIGKKKNKVGADANNDGSITIEDATAIQRYCAEFNDNYNIGGIVYYEKYELPIIF